LIGAGTILNPILKIVTVVAILAASYVFIVRPVLDTTEGVIEKAGNSFRDNQQLRIDSEAKEREFDGARQGAISAAQSMLAGSQPWTEANRAITKCIRAAGKNLSAMRGCDRLGENASAALSDRNFATSYADTLVINGDTAGAARVRDCVAQAELKPGPMNRCQELAERLLFG